jgi:hypothetical protein
VAKDNGTTKRISLAKYIQAEVQSKAKTVDLKVCISCYLCEGIVCLHPYGPSATQIIIFLVVSKDFRRIGQWKGQFRLGVDQTDGSSA